MRIHNLIKLAASSSMALATTIVQEAPAPLDGSNHIQLHSYNYTHGIFSAQVFGYNENYTKEVYLYYTNGQGESTPRTGTNMDKFGDGYNDEWDIYAVTIPILPVEGLSSILNITSTSQINDDYYTQVLNIPVEQDDPLTEAVETLPKPLIAPSGLSDDITKWLDPSSEDSQAYKSKKYLFNNINVEGGVPGLSIASQSRSEPDYWFHWVRDSSFTFEVVLDLYKSLPNRDSPIARGFEDYFLQFIKSSIDEQKDKTAIKGLGDPKFFVNNNTAYQGLWGRPQNDGPAIRSYVIIGFVKEYIKKGGDFNYIVGQAWEEPVKVDLGYNVDSWRNNTYDAWEEVNSDNFFNKMVLRRSLRDGADFAGEVLKDYATFKWLDEEFNQLNETLANFLDANRHLIITNYGPIIHQKATLKDFSVLLGVNHAHLSDGVFAPTNDWVVRSVYEIGTAFVDVFPLDNVSTDATGLPIAPATGRYPEDLYNGVNSTLGNPWFLSSHTFAEYFYTAAKDFQDSGSIPVSEFTLPFWNYFASKVDVTLGTYTQGSEIFEQLIQALAGWGDAYLRLVKEYAGEDGHLSEQFDRETGELRGAKDLTWSYGSLLAAAFKRAEFTGETNYVSKLAQLE